MPKNVFDEVGASGVFANEAVLSPEFLPDVLPGREDEIKEMALRLKPFADGRRSPSLLVFGPPGTGKTSCCRHVLSQLSDFAQSVECVYVNCWQHYTQQSVFAEISRLLGFPVPRRGLATDEVREDLFNHLQNKKVRLVVALDEADRLFHKKEASLFYDMSRSPVPLCVVALTNDQSVFGTLDSRVKSSLSLSPLEFARYDPLQLKEILRARASKAFRRGACDEEAIGLCAAYASKKGGDARVALDVLWKAGKAAEKAGHVKVAESDVRAAFAEQDSLNASVAKRMAGLNDVEQKILDALQEPKYSGDLYEDLGLPERTLRRHLEQLAAKRLVEVEEQQNEDGPGKRRLVRKII